MADKESPVQAAADGTVEPENDESTIDDVEPEQIQAEEKDENILNTGAHPKDARRQLSISVRSLVLGVVIAALVLAVGVLAWLFVGAERKFDAQARQAENAAHAEKVALNYATNAAAMNFQDLDGWKVKLVAGTSPDLKERLNNAAEQMKQILVPLQWNSTSEPLAAKVRSDNGGVYNVDSFVSVETKTVQGPDPLQSTATYRITIDSKKDWQITDVGGIGAAVRGK